MINVWKKREIARAIELRLQGLTWREVASRIGRSESSMWVKLSKLGVKVRANGSTEEAVRENLVKLHHELLQASFEEETLKSEAAGDQSTPQEPAPKTLADATLQEDIEEARRRIILADARESKKKYQEVLAERALEDRIVDVFRERLEAFTPTVKTPPPVLWPVPKMGRKPDSAVLCLSDFHIGQRVSTSETLGFGAYNVRIYCERLYYMQEKVLEQISQNPVTELVVLFLGDILHGALNHGAEKEDNCVVADQFQVAIWSIHQFLCALAFRVPTVRVYSVVGNHGRWPGMKRMPTVNRYSNFDHLVYTALQLSLKVHGLTNISMELNDAPRQVVDVNGSRIICAHGDMLKGGDRQFGVPIHAMTRDVNATTQRFAASEDRAIDYYIIGDKHKSMSLPLARGEYITNGSMVGSDEFSMSFCPAEPMQLLFAIDEKLRKTWSYPLKIGHAPSLATCPYHLPPQVRYMVEDDDDGRAVA